VLGVRDEQPTISTLTLALSLNGMGNGSPLPKGERVRVRGGFATTSNLPLIALDHTKRAA
jgi:hypothetical protein